MAQIIEVAFKGNRREYYVAERPDFRPDDYVIVDADRGEDLGRITATGSIAERKCTTCPDRCGPLPPTRRVLRHATPEDLERARSMRADEPRVRQVVRERVKQFGLKMKVSEAEWQFDGNKLTIYFTAERRVDFRELVRELARTFRTRIELKQIGVRDEAALLGGVGRCGRELCCSTWLREMKPVSLQLAKDQRLSLNPSQISGVCGRLMSCLIYEHDAYVQARKKFPREGRTLTTSRGKEKVVSVDIWRELVILKDGDGGRRTVPLAELKAEVARAGGLEAGAAAWVRGGQPPGSTQAAASPGPEPERRAGKRTEPERGAAPGGGETSHASGNGGRERSRRRNRSNGGRRGA